MVKSMNAAIAGLKAHQTRMDVISNNIANVNTWGYKTRSANFHDAVYSNTINGSAGSQANGKLGGINTSQIGYGATVSSISTNYSTGSGNYTGNPLDCMIDGPAFFIVGPYRETRDTASNAYVEIKNEDIEKNGLFLSRVGMFQPDSNGYLVDNTGNYVYGYEASTDPNTGEVTYNTDKLVPIRIPTDNATNARYEIQTWTIGTDGTIVGVDINSKPVTIGRIAVATVENPSGLEQQSGYLYSVGANAGTVKATQTTAATGEIKSNFLEMSNVDLASDIATMITTQRGYQANTKIITVTDEMLEQLVNMKR